MQAAKLTRPARRPGSAPIPGAPARLRSLRPLVAILLGEVRRLSPAEKLLLVEEMWDEIARLSPPADSPARTERDLAENIARFALRRARFDS